MEYFKKIEFTTANETISNLKNAITKYKVIHLSGYNLSIPIQEFYTNLSDSIGEIFNEDEDILTGERKDNRWIDISYDPDLQDRYRSSNTRQPLHTDDSYVELGDEKSLQFFFCESRAAFGGATTFFDLPDLVACMKSDGEDELLQRLWTTIVHFDKAGNKKIRKILDQDEKGYLANWNYYCIDKENNTPEALALCEDFHGFLESRIIQAGLVMPVQLEKGDAVFFHDDRILHGRNAYFATQKGERCLIKGKIILDPEFELV
jgi:alpha-ketoglutarate-dependent taurine dioxygenase